MFIGMVKKLIVMVNKLEILKSLFNEFLFESQGKSIHNKDAKDTKILNSQIFEFQSYVATKLENMDLNLMINPSIISNEITESFKRSDKPISANEYYLSFFDYLNFKKGEKLELHELIDQFIEAHKSELTWRDIVITATGATRCKTNLRFALDQLRAIGLIKHLDENKKRTSTPSIFGELVYFHWRKSLKPNNSSKKNETKNLDHDIKIRDANFANLFSLINQLSKKEDEKGKMMIKEFLAFKKDEEIKKDIEEILQDIEKFIKNAEITENGIKLKKKVKK
jgi:hypothetical protein